MMLCCVQLAATSFRTNLYKMGGLCQERLKVVLGFHKPDASAICNALQMTPIKGKLGRMSLRFKNASLVLGTE